MKDVRLHELASLYGIQTEYEDAAGVTQRATAESLRAVLAAFGVDATDDALAQRRAETRDSRADAVSVIWGDDRRVPVRAGERVGYELITAEGDRFAGHADTSDGTIELPQHLPAGYHRLIADGRETTLIVAPRRLHGLSPDTGTQADATSRLAPSRPWGIFLPLYAAHTARSWGIGDLGDLRAYREWITEMGGSIVATLPLLATYEEDPSPYSPVSRLFWNELYLELERLPEFDPSDRDEAAIAAARATRLVDYDSVHRLKRRALERMAARFRPDDEFEAFANRASDYAEFRAHRDRAAKISPYGAQRDATNPAGTHRYHLYVQYRMAQQMRAVADDAREYGHGLYLDFPLGVHPNGYDAWRYRDHFAQGVSVGAPPDLFFTKGQDWGFPPLHPEEARRRGYDYFRAAVRHHVEHAGILRFDHVMGLHRLFWIPQGAEARDGVYVRYRADELYAALLVEATRTGTVIVGEDLGTVPPEVPRQMDERGLRRMYVVQYEVKPDAEQPLPRPPRESVASINTHDMPTFGGFWSGKDIEDRQAMSLLDAAGVRQERETREAMRQGLIRYLRAHDLLHRHAGDTVAILQAVLAFLAQSDAEMVLVNLEDLWLEQEPQNVPGIPARSWKQRLRMSLDQVRAESQTKQLLRTVDERRRERNGDSEQETRRLGAETAR